MATSGSSGGIPSADNSVQQLSRKCDGGGDDRAAVSPTGLQSSNPPPVPPHSQQFQQHLNQQHPQPQLREREKEGNQNHATVCSLLSMLTVGVDSNSQQNASKTYQPDANIGLSSQPALLTRSSASTSSPVDHQRMLLLNMANSPESCLALRRAGCIPLLIELMHPSQAISDVEMQPPEIIRTRATKALRNIVQFNPDEKVKRKELRVLKLLEGIRLFSEAVRALLKVKKEQTEGDKGMETEKAAENIQHPTTNITTLMKLSFDEEHRNTMCLLGAINALADLIVSDHQIHGNCASELKDDCLLIRRYSGMTLTNLTFGDGTNKALLCGMREFLSCLVTQLDCENEDICQVTASILRNLSWHADSSSRASLRDSEAVSKLTMAAIKSTKESTLKATLSALWNLSAHSASNKSAICLASPSSLAFLISLLRPNNPVMKQMKTPMLIIENAGGILRNISSQISTSPELRKTLRENHCYEILLEHLKSSSLTVVSNACGTLWNLSGGADCEEDQRKLIDLNAIPMLKSLVYSKHDRISQGASAALRNLLSSRFAKDHTLHLDSRLTAQIYSPSNHHQDAEHGQKSPGSDAEFELDFNAQLHHSDDLLHAQVQHQIHHHQLVLQEPPAAHQQSSAAAASLFQQRFPSPHSKPLTMQMHNFPPFPPSGNVAFRRNSRPATITYASVDAEPLDLTMTSAKSSPIHVISAAEFGIIGNHSMPHHHQRNTNSASGDVMGHTRNSIGGRFYRPQSHNQSHTFLNSPNLIHQTEGETSGRKYSFPGAKFNQSCPEILSRFQHNSLPVTHGQNLSDCNKPLDYSSTSGSTSSSRGAGEASGIGISTDSTGNGGDTTFNYSLQYSELETEDDHAQTHNNRNGHSTNNTKSEDTVKTYYCEGTPHNFSISNSCQDLVQELEYEKEASAGSSDRNNTDPNVDRNSNENSNHKPSGVNNKLHPIDEVPKSYYVENTPAVFSRTSSLSSINSSGGMNAGENRAEFMEPQNQHETHDRPNHRPIAAQRPQDLSQVAPQPLPRKKPMSLFPQAAPRVTFSAEETPLMFSRCSSVASLDSLDVGVGMTGSGGGAAPKNDDELSDYSRRASEVVSPSDLPDSPRGLAPPVRVFEQQQTEPKTNEIANSGSLEQMNKPSHEDAVKVFTVEEKSGFNSCRSLSPLTVDGEELPIISRGKLDISSVPKGGTSTEASGSTTIKIIENKSSFTPVSILKQQKSPTESTEADGRQIDFSHCTASKPRKSGCHDDELKVFAMEGTPFYGVSNATSLSDLTMDLEESSDLLAAPTTTEPATANKMQVETEVMTEVCDAKDVCETSKEPASIEPLETEGNHPNHNETEEEPIYSDAQLLEKCISVGKAMGLPKSQSEYRFDSSSTLTSGKSSSSSNLMSQSLKEGKKGDSDDDDADLAALIMIGRNRAKEKEKQVGVKGKMVKKPDKEVTSELSPEKNAANVESNIEDIPTAVISKQESTDDSSSIGVKSDTDPTSNSSGQANPGLNPKLMLSQHDPNVMSTMSLGSEWNDDAPTLSSPIPSMSISTALRLAGSVGGDSSLSKPPTQPIINKKPNQNLQSSTTNYMNASSMSASMQNELLENVDPPSNFSNLVSSTGCVLPQSPQLNPKSQNSTLSDRINKRWKTLTDPANHSTHSNLSGQKPPPDFDLENSMISVASIKSEIYEMSISSINNEIFESAVEDLGYAGEGNVRLSTGDHSLGGNTYTIFPPENANRLSGVKSTDLSDGGNTVVSEDFTDAEDIEDFETAPAEDVVASEPEKADVEKEVRNSEKDKIAANPSSTEVEVIEINVNRQVAHPSNGEIVNHESRVPIVQSVAPMKKPLMEVHPLDTSSKYNTYVVKKSPSDSPKSSPRQKRRDDPERYRTRTITPTGYKLGGNSSAMSDANGNPDLKFATFRVSGPKILKSSNMNSNASESSVSPESTPGNSPKGVRGRRKPLYSSLPPSSIIRKGKSAAPPVPPKPSVRAPSPARSTTSSTSAGGVYVRPTRTTELRIAANQSRDNSPKRGDPNSSKNSSNSSLNALHHHLPSRYSDTGLSTASAPSSRPKVAPKPPVRTTPSICSNNSAVSVASRGVSGSSTNVQIKVSNSSFGFGQQKIADSGASSNMKGYSTLPKSTKLSQNDAKGSTRQEKLGFRAGESKESVAGSEKSSKSGIGKITNLFKKMDFRGHGKEPSSLPVPINPHQTQGKSDHTGLEKEKSSSKSSKFSNLFGRNKSKEKSNGAKQQPQPFREPVPLPNLKTDIPKFENHADHFPPHDSSSSTACGVWVRRDGENKVIVPPFNYTPPGSHKRQEALTDKDGNTNTSDESESPGRNSTGGSEETNGQGQSNNNAPGSAKITTV